MPDSASPEGLAFPLFGDLAALIGASRSKVNLAFGDLEARGAIRRAGRRLHCRIGALEKFAEVYAL